MLHPRILQYGGEALSLAKWLAALLWGNVGLRAVAALAALGQQSLIRRIGLGLVTPAEAMLHESRMTIISTVQILLYIATAVLFLIWIYRASSNLRKLGAEGVRHTPGMAVGAFFIPFMNLYYPYTVVKEIWQASEPVDQRSSTALLKWWWGFWLTSNLLGQIAAGMMDGAKTLDALSRATWAILLAECVGLLSAWLALRVVMEVSQRQEWRLRA